MHISPPCNLHRWAQKSPKPPSIYHFCCCMVYMKKTTYKDVKMAHFEVRDELLMIWKRLGQNWGKIFSSHPNRGKMNSRYRGVKFSYIRPSDIQIYANLCTPPPLYKIENKLQRKKLTWNLCPRYASPQIINGLSLWSRFYRKKGQNSIKHTCSAWYLGSMIWI